MERFNYDACEYDKGRRGENILFWVKETIRIANLDGRSVVLDLGCGTGNYTLEFEQKVFGDVFGLDPSIGMMRVGRSKDLGDLVNWCCGVAEVIPFTDESFDCIFSSQVWHHLRDKQKTANECYRVLKCDSPLVIRTISHDQWREKTVCNFFPEVLPSQLKVYPSMSEFKKHLRKAKFGNVDIFPYRIEGYTYPEEFIEAAEKKLWSTFRYVSEENLKRGIEQLKSYGGQAIRNDELITLVVGWK